MRQWLLDWVSDASKFHTVIFAVALWHIWENINNIINREVVACPIRVVGKIKAYINFSIWNDFCVTTSTCQRSIIKLSPPMFGLMLMNVDAADLLQVTAHGLRSNYSRPFLICGTN
jgi:hypothetical protein